MPSPDAPVPSAPRPQAVTLDVRTILAGIVAVAAGIAVRRDPALNEALFHLVNDLGPAAPTAWSCLSVAGLALSAWIYLTAFAEQRPERVAQLLWIIVGGGLTASFIKHHLPSPRPFLALGEGHLAVIGDALSAGSMPSGHSAMAAAMLAVMVAERRRFDEHAAVGGYMQSGPGLAIVGLLAAGIALSRLAVGAHWPADALVGAGLGLVFGGFAPHAWFVRATTRQLRRPLGQRLMAAGLLACAACIGATPSLLQAAGLAGTKLARQLATGYPLAEPLQAVLAIVALVGAWRWWRASRRAVAGAA